MPERDAVVVFGIADLYMAIFLHRQFALLFPCKGLGWKGAQVLSLHMFE